MIKVVEHEVPLKDFQKWIAALRSGKYKQTKGALQTRQGYCCLGVACKVSIPEEYIELNDNGFIAGSEPYEHNQPYAPLWLQYVNDDFAKKTSQPLSGLNDEGVNQPDEDEVIEPFSFSEIADLLELVYIHKILD